MPFKVRENWKRGNTGNENAGNPLSTDPWRNPLLADVFKNALPVCPRFRAAPMDPQTIGLDHGRPLFEPPEKHALLLLKSLQIRVRLEAQPIPERFGDHNPPRLIDPEFHTISNTIYHCTELPRFPAYLNGGENAAHNYVVHVLFWH